MEDDLVKSSLKPSHIQLIDDKGLSDCNNFLVSAKDRLKYLESENERIENSYRDYQHKIKSKYYPINDDPDTEMRVVTTKKSTFNPDNVDAFLESTLKASAKAKQMRDELENEALRHVPKNESQDMLYQKVVNLRIVDEMIKSVPLIQDERRRRDEDDEEANNGRSNESRAYLSSIKEELRSGKNNFFDFLID